MDKDSFDFAPVTPEVVRDLQDILGVSGVSLDLEKRQTYSRDEVPFHLWKIPPLAEVLCFPETTEQVSALMAYADAHRIPVTPRGAGTGLSGGAVPAFGGILLSFERMNRIVEVDPDNLTLTVQPGVVTSEITKAASNHGLLYAGDPCSGDASYIGGNVAENAGGNKVVKYGPTGSHVLGLEAVLPDGSVCWFGGKRRKDATGYDLAHLLVGSEGTLAVITQIILKLLPLPARVADLLVPFPDVPSAMAFVPRLMTEARIVPSSIEFMDQTSLRLTEQSLKTTLPHYEAGGQLIIQLEGNDAPSLQRDVERVGDLCMKHGALNVYVAQNRNHRDKIWKIRKSLAEQVWAQTNRQIADEDVVVPTSRVPDLMTTLEKTAALFGISFIAYGHVGDGNIHVSLYKAEEIPHWESLVEEVREQLYRKIRDLGGTLTGEHGVGLKRPRYVPLFLDEAQIRLQRRIKRAFDPHNILNPGKALPWDPDPSEEEKGGAR